MIDVGWVAPIIGALGFLGFVVVLSVLYVFWRSFWGDHDDS